MKIQKGFEMFSINNQRNTQKGFETFWFLLKPLDDIKTFENAFT